MAVRLVSGPTCKPNPTHLPRRLEVKYTLVGNRTTERCSYTYSLPASLDVCFEGGGKTATRTKPVVMKQNTTVIHHLTLVRCGGQPAAAVELGIKIVDEGERETNRTCIVVIR